MLPQVFIATLNIGNLDVATVFDRLGDAFSGMKSHDKALAHFDKALLLFVQHVGKNDVLVGATAAKLADALRQMRRYKEAISMYEKALEIQEKSFGNTHTVVAHTVELMGLCYSKLDQHENAMPLLERAVGMVSADVQPTSDSRSGASLWRTAGGVSDKEKRKRKITYLHNLAVAYMRSKMWSPALRMLKEVVELCEAAAITGSRIDNIDVAMVLTKACFTAFMLQQHLDAIDFGERAVRIFEMRTSAQAQLESVHALTCVGNSCELVGQASKAQDYFLKALAILNQNQHPLDEAVMGNIATTANHLAHSVENQGRFVEALMFYRQVLAVRHGKPARRYRLGAQVLP